MRTTSSACGIGSFPSWGRIGASLPIDSRTSSSLSAPEPPGRPPRRPRVPRRLSMIRRRLAAVAAAALFCAAPAFAQEKLPPLRTGVDGTFAPHAMPKLGGGIERFQIDLFTDVARPLKRESTIDAVSFSTLIPGMQSGRYDFIAAPTTVTKERAENMLFTAGYLWTAYQFGIKKGSEPIKDWADLKGKSVSVNKGTPYETLS